MSDNIVMVLLGKHGYSLDPETETILARVCLILGFVIGGLVFS